MISIVVTVYNKENFIQTTLNSILSQIIPLNEVIVVNDGSSDKSLDIINEMNLPPEFDVITTENQGVSKARNLGLKMVSQDYVYFVDGDDILEPNALDIFLTAIGANSSFSLYAANRSERNSKKKVANVPSKSFSLEDYLKLLIQFQNLCWTSAVVINKKIALKVQFNTAFSHGEDRDFFMNVLVFADGYWTDEVVATYINDPIGLSAKPMHISEDLHWARIKEYQNELSKHSEFYYYCLKYKAANIINNLKQYHFKNAISWLK
jgi:glycosyltransferase involved in cell wall biosynthesis|tara:strand:+ start:162 stop:953 length:792 start_codon:yes stop_codon:yes gene_type:complete